VRLWRPARKTGLLAKPVRFARNVWLLRRELLALVFRRRPKEPEHVELRCIRCGRELTKPCKPMSPCHVFKWPEGIGEPVLNGQRVTPGTLVYVRRQKSRGGVFRPDQDIRLKPF
jgi:hypothetical protein